MREKLAELTPNRGDLARELRDRLDTELLQQMLTRGVMEDGAMRAVFRFMVERLADLQAPARGEATSAWFNGEMAMHIRKRPDLNSVLCARGTAEVVKSMGPDGCWHACVLWGWIRCGRGGRGGPRSP